MIVLNRLREKERGEEIINVQKIFLSKKKGRKEKQNHVYVPVSQMITQSTSSTVLENRKPQLLAFSNKCTLFKRY